MNLLLSSSKARSLAGTLGRTTRRKLSDATTAAGGCTSSIQRGSGCDGASAASASTTTTNLARGGTEDGVVALSVGGTTFRTLRSTICRNAVLSRHLERAESNGDLTVAADGGAVDGSGAVFVDRDPKHFPHILQYLRDKVDFVPVQLKQGSLGKRNISRTPLLVPRDSATLKELEREAIFYGMSDLQQELGCLKLTGLVSQMFGGQVGWRDAVPLAASIVAELKAGYLLAVGALGLGSVGAATGMRQQRQQQQPQQQEGGGATAAATTTGGWKEIGKKLVANDDAGKGNQGS